MSAYKYNRPVRHSNYQIYRGRLKLLIGSIVVIGLIAGFILLNLRTSSKPAPIVTTPTYSTVSTPLKTFTGPYFQFQDSGQWVEDQKDSTGGQYIYTDYRGQVIEAQLDIYINKDPSRAYVTRVLPIRIINNNSFQITGVSDPCVSQYVAGEPHRVKEVSISDALMMCDPDDPQYSVVLSEIGGDYHLHLTRANGQVIQVIIIYRNQDTNPRPNNLINIASSFKAI